MPARQRVSKRPVPEAVAFAPATSSPFVGRRRELEELLTAFEGALAGRASVMMVVGEPGIGKTRTAEELVAVATKRGARAAWGRCWEGEGAPAYWPWIQVIRSLLDSAGASKARRAEVARLIPELAEGNPVDSRRDPEQRRFQLFDSLVTFLAGEARAKPLVLVLDDLHWADQPSLLALQFLARGLGGAGLLVICTYRDVEVGQGHPLLQLLGQLARESGRIVLGGLSEAEVARVIESTSSTAPPPGLVAAVHRHTEGNPFFVTEVVRLLAGRRQLDNADDEASWELAVPQGVREMIGTQLGTLSQQCNHLLRLAAMVGREFDVSLVQKASGLSGKRVVELMEQALDARVLTPVGAGDQNTRLAFAHTLTREAISEQLGPARRMRLHLKVAETLETLAAGDPSPHLPALAYHFVAAIPEADVARAVKYCVLAGEQADARLAFEEAANHYERAIKALEFGGGDARERAELLLSLGDSHAKAADKARARQAFLSAADLARRQGDAHLLVRAALGFGGRFIGMRRGVVDNTLIGILEEALQMLPQKNSAVRATVLARLSRALFYAGQSDRRLSLAEQALEMARRVDDIPAQLHALNSLFWALGEPEHTDRRLATAIEMTRLADISGDAEMSLQGHHWRLNELATAGDMAGVDAEIIAYGELAAELCQPLYSWYALEFPAMRAAMTGDFDEAERLARQALEAGRKMLLGLPIDDIFRGQMFHIRSEQGRLKEAEESLDTGFGSNDSPGRAARAAALNRVGRSEEAVAEYESLMNADLAGLPGDSMWLTMVTNLADLCATLGDASRAGDLYEMLTPYRDNNVVVGGGLACLGSVSRPLGRLAATLGRWDDAIALMESALALHERMGAKPMAAHTRYELAHIRLQSGRPDAADRCAELLGQAVETAKELGMLDLKERCLELKGKRRRRGRGLDKAGVAPAGDARAAAVPVVGTETFLLQGDYWVIRFEGREARLKDAKGCQYLARLLGQPGREIHVADLAGAGGIPIQEGGPAIDDQAKAEYKRRVHDLDSDLTEAKDFNDWARAERLQDEMDFITNQLLTAYGIGGRARTENSGERIRKAVTNRIRATVSRVQDVHPRLGQHLSNSLRTGTFCGYFPESPVKWRL